MYFPNVFFRLNLFSRDMFVAYAWLPASAVWKRKGQKGSRILD